MNFKQLPDKAPKLCAIALSIILSLTIIYDCILSASAAFDLGDLIPYENYLQDYDTRLSNINDGALRSILDNPNLTDAEKAQYVEVYALQQFDYRLALEALQKMRENQNIPDTVSVSGSLGCAMYKVSGDDSLYPVYIMPVSGGKYPWIAATSQHFNLSISLSNYQAQGEFPSVTRYVQYGVNGSTSTGFFFQGSGQNRHIYMTDTSGFFLNWEQQRDGCYFYISSNSIPTFAQGQRLSFTGAIGGYGANLELPDAEIDSLAPWDYYNHYLLPQIINNYDIDNIEQFIAFPGGYYPDRVPPSQQYPSGGGISIGDQYYFDIDINFPTYPNGEPQTDESGETITETVIVTDTRPTDAVYQFTVPTLPGLQIDSSAIPFNTNISEYTNPLLGFFDLITEIFDASGVLPVIPILFTMGIIFFVIYKCS